MADQTYEAGVRLTADTSQIQGASAALIRTMQNLQGSVDKVAGALEKRYEPTARDSAARTDKFKGAADRLRGSLGQIHGTMSRVTGSMLAMGAGALGVGFGIGAIARAVVGGNIELERMQKQVAGTLFAFREWKEGVDAVTAVRVSLRDARKEFLPILEEAEEAYAVPATALAGALQTLMGPLQDLGVEEQRIMKLSASSGAAMRVFGTNAEAVGTLISRIITTRTLPMRSQDPFTQFIRQALSGMGDLKKAKPEDILRKIETSMERLGPAAQEMSQGFEGTMFRLRDFISDTLRDVGGPAFRYIADQLKVWKERLGQSVEGSKTLAEVYATRVLDVVKKIGSALAFIADHWKEIAVVVGGLKLIGLTQQVIQMGSAFSGVVGAIRGMGASLGAATGVVGGLTRALGMMGTVGVAAAAGVGLGLAGWEMFKDTKARAWIERNVFKNPYYMPGAEERRERVAKTIQEMSKVEWRGDEEDEVPRWLFKKGEESKWKTANERAKADPFSWMKMKGEDALPRTADLVKPGKRKFEQHFHGPINIKQEFRDADPDNVYVQLKEGLEENGDRRVQSALTDTFGG